MKTSTSFRSIQYAVAYIGALVSLYPIFLMLTSSLKTNIQILKNPLALPSSLNFTAYSKLFEQISFGTYFWNSAVVSVVSVTLILLFSVLASFYIARYPFRWNGALFFYFLLGMMIPIKLGIVPLFLLMKKLALLNSLWSLISVYTAVGLPLAVLILTGFFRTLPKELEEAAKIDGASDLGVMWHVLVPLIRPALGTVMIMNFIMAWNDFFFPLIFIQEDSMKTIPVGMLSLFGQYSTDLSMLFAGLTLSSLPMIILFFLASKQFMEGMTAGAVK
jgi:raffinose/stachyose/melibiose transport system permease protein